MHGLLLLALLLLAACAGIEPAPSAPRQDPQVRSAGRIDVAVSFVRREREERVEAVRTLTWRAILEPAERSIDSIDEPRIRSLLIASQEIALAPTIEAAKAESRPFLDELWSWVADDATVAAARSRFERQLEQEIARWVERIEAPAPFAASPRAGELLTIERVVATEVLRARYRDAILEAFDEATAFIH